MMKKAVAFILVLMLGISGVFAQLATYPVQVQTMLMPPYSPDVSSFYSGIRESLVVTVTNLDVTKSPLQVRLRMRIKSNSFSMFTPPEIYTPVIDLTGGLPMRLSLNDLEFYFRQNNYRSSGSPQFTQTNLLPDGFYQMWFEAYDMITGKLLSNPNIGVANVFISTGNPPKLNYPEKGALIAESPLTNILFSWTPSHLASLAASYNTGYEFTLVEVYDKSIPPEAIFSYAAPLYRQEFYQTSFVYNAAYPPLIPGMRYAWQVRAVAKEAGAEIPVFKDNGFSEIFYFDYTADCRAVDYFGIVYEEGKINLSWNPTEAGEYIIEYKKKGSGRWNSETAFGSVHTFYNLQPGSDYEFRVGCRCVINDAYIYSGIKEYNIPKNNRENNPQCGIMPQVNLADKQPIATLQAGELVFAGDFPVYIKEVRGNGSFSGSGYVSIPYLGSARISVTFENIRVNSARQLLSGFFETKYDPTAKGLILDVDAAIHGGQGVGDVRTGEEMAQNKVDFAITPDMEVSVTAHNPLNDSDSDSGEEGQSISKGENSYFELVFTDPNTGNKQTIQVPELPTTITDKNGDTFAVSEDGKLTAISTQSDIALNAQNKETLRSDIATIRFSATPNTVYAFDAYDDIYKKDVDFYTNYKESEEGFPADCKFILEGKSDELYAYIATKGDAFDASKIKFISTAGKEIQANREGDKWKLTLSGSKAGDGQVIYAVQTIENGETATLGKLKILSYSPKTVKVGLVPVNGFKLDTENIKKELNRIYNPVGITCMVTVEDSFNDSSWDLNGDGKLQVDGSGFFSTLTGEMKALNQTYTNTPGYKSDVFYLFMVKEAQADNTTGTVLGDMPRGKQFGYLFSGATGQTAAHELGHGVFKLEHIFNFRFSQSELTDNLMNYPGGDRLVKRQWDMVHAPGLVIGVFEKDESGMYKSWSFVYGDIIENIPGYENETKSFITLAGDVITLPANARDLAFFEGYLVGFTIEKERWIALVKSSKKYFAGFYKDAVETNDSNFSIEGKKPYTGFGGSTNIAFYAQKNGNEDCSSINIYKATLKSIIQSGNGGIDKENLYSGEVPYAITGLTIISSTEQISTISDAMNCLQGRAREFYKFVIEHYASNNVVLTDEYKKELANYLAAFETVFINQLDGDFKDLDKKLYEVRFREMLNYGHLELLAKIKGLAANSTLQKGVLVVTMENYERFKDDFLLYKFLKEEIDSDCTFAKESVLKMANANSISDLLDWEFLKSIASDTYETLHGHDVFKLLSCILKNIRIPESFWNPNRLDNETNKVIDILFKKAGISPDSFTAIIPREYYNYSTACGCGAWNSLVDLFLGISTLATGATSNPVEIYNYINNTISNLTKEGAFSAIGKDILEMLKEHHGYVEGYGVDSYQVSYGICYDAVFIASFFVGAGEVKSAGAVGDLSKTALAFRKIVVNIAEQIPENILQILPKNAKIYIIDAALNAEVAEFSAKGLQILKPIGSGTGQVSHILYESSEAITDVSGKTGILKIGKDGTGTVVAWIEEVAKGGDELLIKFNTLTQNELKSLYGQLVKTEITGTTKTITQAEILSELQVNTSLINPYSFSYPIEDIILAQDAVFVRAYNQSSVGRWMISIEDMKSFASVDEFINKTALPIVEYGSGNLVKPTNLSIVKIPKGTVVRKSVARPQDWGGQGHLPGGSIQYEIRSFDYNTMKEWYKDLGNINEYLK